MAAVSAVRTGAPGPSELILAGMSLVAERRWAILILVSHVEGVVEQEPEAPSFARDAECVDSGTAVSPRPSSPTARASKVTCAPVAALGKFDARCVPKAPRGIEDGLWKTSECVVSLAEGGGLTIGARPPSFAGAGVDSAADPRLNPLLAGSAKLPEVALLVE